MPRRRLCHIVSLLLTFVFYCYSNQELYICCHYYYYYYCVMVMLLPLLRVMWEVCHA